MTSIRLYSKPSSSCAFRVRIALNLLKLDYEIVDQSDLKDPTYKKLNPQLLIPSCQIGKELLTQVSDSSRSLNRM